MSDFIMMNIRKFVSDNDRISLINKDNDVQYWDTYVRI